MLFVFVKICKEFSRVNFLESVRFLLLFVKFYFGFIEIDRTDKQELRENNEESDERDDDRTKEDIGYIFIKV